MAKLIICIALALTFIAVAEALNGACPLSSQHTTCSPKCLQDHECSAKGEICCPNLCNARSCVRPKVGGSQSGGVGGSGSSSGKQTGTGSYCGNRKCANGEKCAFDRNTKRENCVRG